jgi:hypothetical protein
MRERGPETYIGLNVQCRLFLLDFKLEFSPQFFEKYSSIKFHENPSSGVPVVPCGQTDMTKLIVAFRNFSNAPKTNRLHSMSQYAAVCIAVFATSFGSFKSILREIHNSTYNCPVVFKIATYTFPAAVLCI